MANLAQSRQRAHARQRAAASGHIRSRLLDQIADEGADDYFDGHHANPYKDPAEAAAYESGWNAASELVNPVR